MAPAVIRRWDVGWAVQTFSECRGDQLDGVDVFVVQRAGGLGQRVEQLLAGHLLVPLDSGETAEHLLERIPVGGERREFGGSG